MLLLLCVLLGGLLYRVAVRHGLLIGSPYDLNSRMRRFMDGGGVDAAGRGIARFLSERRGWTSAGASEPLFCCSSPSLRCGGRWNRYTATASAFGPPVTGSPNMPPLKRRCSIRSAGRAITPAAISGRPWPGTLGLRRHRREYQQQALPLGDNARSEAAGRQGEKDMQLPGARGRESAQVVIYDLRANSEERASR